VDYEQMGVQELRAECQARGLGTARARADLIQRLTDHDTQQEPSLAEGEFVLSPSAVKQEAAAAAFEPPTTRQPGVFQQTFDAEPDGPDEETHLAYRQATLTAATDAGFRTRGDARLAAVRDGMWVYEVSVRQEV
jgi:hypothetical protein